MTRRQTAIHLLIALFVVACASQSFADISNEAVLFLRIAPGARAAGMGEAFVAVADDATATHYNPAGLGAYPLSQNWVEMKVPDEYRPITGVAPLKVRGGSGYSSYDIWALTRKGLLRYDNRKWHSGETITTRTDDVVSNLVSRYFGEKDETRLAQLVDKVAAANNSQSVSSLEELRDKVMAVVPKTYNALDALKNGFDSLIVAYPQCRINWTSVQTARQLFAEGMKDSTLTEKEIDRISFAVEKGKNRFVPEQLVFPYAVKFEGEPTAIVSTGDAILIATTTGVVKYNGRSWQSFTTDNGLPSNKVLCLAAVGQSVYLGTDKGLCVFNGLTVESFLPQTNPPSGAVMAVGGSNRTDVFAVVDQRLYHFDGVAWSTTFPYTVVLDDTPDKLATKFALYGTAKEHQLYVAELLKSFDLSTQPAVKTDTAKAAPADTSKAVPVADTTKPSDSSAAVGDSLKPADSVTVAKESVVIDSATLATATAAMKPGSIIMIPYVAEIRGQVNTIATGMGKTVWLGTAYGLATLDKDGWAMTGYKKITLDSARTIGQIADERKGFSAEQQAAYAENLKLINDLTSDTVPAGSVIRVHRNAAATSIKQIGQNGEVIYVATADGLLDNSQGWQRSGLRGLGDASDAGFVQVRDGFWLTNREKIVIRAKGRSEINTMYVKWLPELSSDLYYTFLSGVKQTNNWGTFGGSITFISYGKFVRTDATGQQTGTWDGYDFAVGLSWGTSVTNKWKFGVTGKFIYSHLASAGQGAEQGSGTASDFAVDLGLLYHWTPKLNFGMALTNIGPKISYIDAAQSDDLPRNLAVGFAYKLFQTEYFRLTVSTEANKIMTKLTQSFSDEMKQVVLNAGVEATYLNLISLRGGRTHDEEGNVKVWTFGAGLQLPDKARADFAYIPNQGTSPLSNILRLSLSFVF